MTVKAAVIYPIPWPRVSYHVKYHRTEGTNTWRATATRGDVERHISAKGAVAYSTARWGEERPEDARFASVWVLLAVNPALDSPGIMNRPDIRRMMADQAMSTATEMFLTQHPAAVVEPEGEEY
jgi:hypothetical protein